MQKVVTRGLNDVWDVDLMDMSNLAKYNDGVHFIKNKSTKETLTAIKNVLHKSRLQPKTFRSDAGKKFVGKDVQQYLADCEIHQQGTRNEKKGNYAKRVIQTLKKKIYKYLYYHKTEKYIDVLQELVEGYNESYHSGMKRAPTTINKENELQVWTEQYLPKKSNKIQKVKFKFSAGDMVRISGARSPFTKDFGQTYTEELFKVRQRFATIPATYMLEDLNKVQVASLFYEPEMVLVKGKGKDSEFLVEKILAERTRNGHKQSTNQMERIPRFIQLVGTS